MHARALAATVVYQVVEQGRSLSDVLPDAVPQLSEPSERALLQEICYGTLRWYLQLLAVAQSFLRKPLKRKDGDVVALLCVGLYQLLHMRVAPHAAVSLSVSATDELGKSWAKGLVNAVLRSFQREPGVLQRVCQDESVAYAHPPWLLQLLQQDWPNDWRAIATANNARAPMVLRVNTRKVTRADYANTLAEASIQARNSEIAPEALILDAPTDVLHLPAFEQGIVSVQDAAAQLAAVLLNAAPGERILDACAAPGGKTAHILERQPQLGEMVAIDADAARLQRVDENLRRLGLRARVVAGDAAEPSHWWDGRAFDRILLDAPCSATGVIRRHPDIKALRHAEDVDQLVQQQRRLLDALWTTLKPGGTLVYATCSVLRRENDLQLREFMRAHVDAAELPIQADWGRASAVGRQILPGESDMDGFYYACVRKNEIA